MIELLYEALCVTLALGSARPDCLLHAIAPSRQQWGESQIPAGMSEFDRRIAVVEQIAIVREVGREIAIGREIGREIATALGNMFG